MTQLSPLQIIALNKSFDDSDLKLARPKISVGEHHLDFNVHFEGKIKVGANYYQRIVNKIDTWKLLKVALNKLNNVTLQTVIEEAENISDPETTEFKNKVNKVIKELKAETEVECYGKITGDIVPSLIDEPQVILPTVRSSNATKSSRASRSKV